MSHTNPYRWSKLALVAGYLGLLGAVVVAHRTPATGYELSLYRATPTAVWAGLALAVVVGCPVVLRTAGRVRDAGRLLLGASAITLFAMPVLRGYHFYGAGDSMSHLGWARELAAGSILPTDVLYPAIHVLTVAIGAVGGVPLATSNLYLVLVVLPVVFVAFVALCTGLLTGTRYGLVVGALAAILFSPINNISIHPTAHPASQAVLFLPFVVYLLLRYVTAPSGRGEGLFSLPFGPLARFLGNERRLRVTGLGVVLAVVSATVVLVHPQQALNVIVLFASIAGLQFLYRRFASDHPIADHRPLYAQTAVIVGLFAAWAPQFPTVRGAVIATVQGLLGEEAGAGDVVAAKSQSLTAVGGDIGILFVRLFLPGVILSLLAGVLVLGVLRSDLLDTDAEADGLLVYLAVALFPLFAVFLLLVAGGSDDMYFRYQGFIMVPVTILAAVALTRGLRAGGSIGPSAVTAGRLVAVLFLVLLPVAAVGLHPSPYMYQPTPHVTESSADGYTAAFQHRVPDREFVGIRGGPRRYVDAAYGTERATTTLDFPGYRDRLPESVFNRANYTDYFESDRYLAVTPANYRSELGLYEGFRYSERGFQRLDSSASVSRIRANDGFTLYYVDGEEA